MKPKEYLEQNGWKKLSEEEIEMAEKNESVFTTLMLVFVRSIKERIGKRMRDESGMDEDFEGPDMALLPNAILSESGNVAKNNGTYIYATVEDGTPKTVKQQKDKQWFWRRSAKKQTGFRQDDLIGSTNGQMEWGKSGGSWWTRDKKTKRKKPEE